MLYLDTDRTLELFYKNHILKTNRSFGNRGYCSLDNKRTLFYNYDLKKYVDNWRVPYSTLKTGTPKSAYTPIAPKPKHSKYKISVITLLKDIDPKYLLQSIYSTLWQWTNFDIELEYIFVVDPPCENERVFINEVCQGLENPPRINLKVYAYYNEANFGRMQSLNHALKASTGDYIFFLDSDDYSHPERFYWSIMLLEHKSQFKAVSFVPFRVITENRGIENIEISYNRSPFLCNPLYILLDAVYNRMENAKPFLNMGMKSLCIKKEVAENCRIDEYYYDFENNIYELGDLFLMHILKKYPAGVYQDSRCMAYIREHSKQFSKARISNEKDIALNNKLITAKADDLYTDLDRPAHKKLRNELEDIQTTILEQKLMYYNQFVI